MSAAVPSPDVAPDLTERYGTGRRSRRPALVAAAAALMVLALAWVVWASAFHGRPEVTSALVGYDVHDHSVTATYTVVRRDADVSATCLLRAYADDHNVVGERSVTVDSGPVAADVRTTLRTDRRATSVEVVGCTAPGQPQQR